ncbi:TetR family transcriptional regulator [Aeromicrobium sp. A1-2]|uniref:TetR/AcrR family transcriptional regulator n=1 Tax=Aeromicrobium sp. A1-2 TaxID=2107713 RepID=UPI000E521184|nr:TetR/AcrR family transcriptional regulator [Aeromicrobium sp. A1-2]AXT85899.1 TetR family transcriptional regulator [Aeromicrobium sp. A1-2]
MSVNAFGRPRDARLDRALLDATCALLAEHGYAGTTIDAVARLAGTTKPALYRRHRNRAELVIDALVDRFGDDPTHDTGTLRGDLLDLQQHQLVLFGDPVLRGAVGGLLDELGTSSAAATAFVERFLTPRRAATARLLERAGLRGEIEPCEDTEWICDLITGPLMMRALLPGLPPLDQHLVEQSVDAALAVLGTTGS